MVNRLRFILFLLVPALTVNASAADVTDTHTAIFDPQFHTLQTKVNGNDQLPPVIMLNSDDLLNISFDELSSDRRYMRYELIHCDAAWHPDILLPNEYVEGFNEGTIDDFSFSEATLVQYIHYRLLIPSPGMAIKLSGNYLLRVYDETTPDDTILQIRFRVAEPAMKASASVTSRTDTDYNGSHQQLTISVDTKGIPTNDIFNDVIVTVEQNGRTDNAVTIAGPSRIAGSSAWWEHNRALIFPAGNEYRRMETVSTTYPGMGIADISFEEPLYHITLITDESRASSPYTYDQTQHGRFRVRRLDADNSDTEAEYVMVHFTLDMPELADTDIFIDGDFTQRRFSPESLMTYNRATNRYEASMLLKQGAYNYQYLTVGRSGQTIGQTAAVEGDKYPTVNEYLVSVFYRQPGSRYDRLVAVTQAFSGK